MAKRFLTGLFFQNFSNPFIHTLDTYLQKPRSAKKLFVPPSKPHSKRAGKSHPKPLRHFSIASACIRIPPLLYLYICPASPQPVPWLGAIPLHTHLKHCG
jgi:hypothetical protein